MAGLTRKTNFPFAGSSLNTGEFGTAQLGTKILTNDPLVIQGTTGSGSTLAPSTAWNAGWVNAVIGGNNLPPLEEMEGVQVVSSYQISYLLARGIPEYDSGTTYNAGDITRPPASSQLYQSIGNANVGNALPSAVTNSFWTYLGDLANLANTSNGAIFNGGSAGGSANALTATSTGFTLAAENGIAVLLTATNTSAATLNVNGGTTKNIYRATAGGPVALVGGELFSGNIAILIYDGTQYQLVNPATISAVSNSNVLGSPVSLNNTGLFFDGPSVSVGTTGAWFVSGTVTLKDTSAAGSFNVKLWDGTTVIASCVTTSASNSDNIAVSLSGIIVSPAANLKISVQDTVSTSGVIQSNVSGAGKDSLIAAFRIG